MKVSVHYLCCTVCVRHSELTPHNVGESVSALTGVHRECSTLRTLHNVGGSQFRCTDGGRCAVCSAGVWDWLFAGAAQSGGRCCVAGFTRAKPPTEISFAATKLYLEVGREREREKEREREMLVFHVVRVMTLPLPPPSPTPRH